MHKPAGVPLQPQPIIGTPFERVGMDLIGPLPKTRRGNQHALVIVDYATRFPEAFLLTAPTSRHIAEKILELFSRVGFPKEILTDQGTPFVSRLMREVCKILNLQKIRTSVYHPQTDGLVERYNGTLEVDGKEWDQLLPFALYVIRGQTQSSLGCSSFEMLYGRQPRTLLDMTCEAWERESPEETRGMLDNVQNLKSKIGKLCDLAYSNLERNQERQKTTYDKGKKWRRLAVDDWVLVLLPSSMKKFKAEWTGPYRVVDTIGKTSYKVQITRKKKNQICHINILKKWLGDPSKSAHLTIPRPTPPPTR